MSDYRLNPDGSVEGEFANDDRRFILNIGQLLALEERRDAGVAEIRGRLASGVWRLDDVRETIRLGLIGSGVDTKIAKRIVDEHIVTGTVGRAAILAQYIITAALIGREPLGKPEAAETEKSEPGSPPPSFTAAGPQ